MGYICKFRRNNKERYWKTKRIVDLYDFKELLEKMFRGTTEERLEIIIELEKLKEEKK